MRPITLRGATPRDAPAMQRLAACTLRRSNEPDYGAANVARVVWNFRATALCKGLRQNCFILAEEPSGPLVGMASLAKTGKIGAFFVHPGRQRQGIGRLILAELIGTAKAAGLDRVTLRASLAGAPFYLAQGFERGMDVWHGDERTIAMHLTLGGPPRAGARTVQSP